MHNREIKTYLETVKRIRNTLAAADNTLVLIVPKAALVANADQRGGAHVAIAHGTLAVALVAESADGYTALLAAHYEIGVVAGHGEEVCVRSLTWEGRVFVRIKQLLGSDEKHLVRED